MNFTAAAEVNTQAYVGRASARHVGLKADLPKPLFTWSNHDHYSLALHLFRKSPGLAIKRAFLASAVATSFVSADVEAGLVTGVFGGDPFLHWSTDSGNFTFLDTAGGSVGGSNDLNVTWDGNAFNASSDYTGPGSAANITMSSTTAFFGHLWTAHDIQVFTPGSYTFDVTAGGGNAEVGTVGGTVASGQLGMHMLFDWNGNLNSDIFVVLDRDSVFGAGVGSSANPECSALYEGTITKNCLYDGVNFGSAGQPAGNTVWSLASVDGNGDGIMGTPFAAGGVFADFNATFNFNLTQPVPVPAAVWLFGSGLLGLAGAARRKKNA